MSEPSVVDAAGLRVTRHPPVPLAWRGDGAAPTRFHRGAHPPYAIRWFGSTALLGHLRRVAASIVASQAVDTRDWMRPERPHELLGHAGRILKAPGVDAPTLVERLERPLWIDFVADTGDDRDVSAAVARLVFAEYAPPESADVEVLPRGDILLFGGDTAYPVATDVEIHNRVCVPFNRVLKERQDGKLRVLLGIPGNHDWYDGLDGFARMFRARRGSIDRASITPDATVDRGGQLGHFIDWVEAFRVGEYVTKRTALPLFGYTPVQGASYFALRLAPELDLWGVDRQLRALDYTQKSYFAAEHASHHGLVLVLADPIFAMLAPNAVGHKTLEDLDIALEDDGPLVLTGDTHHYCRQEFGTAMQVVAGGGGAFLHPTPIWRRGLPKPAAEFPGPRACFGLAMQVPWQIAGGRSGFLAHTAAALLYLPVLALWLMDYRIDIACVVIGALAWMTCSLLGGWRNPRRWTIRGLALLCGAWVGGLPWMLREIVGWIGGLLPQAQALAAYVASIYPAVLGFGTFLMVLTLLGLEQHQAFSALAHPGYKHFVRLRVRRDGSAIDGWVLGKIDTLDPRSEVVLVDEWTWLNTKRVKD